MFGKKIGRIATIVACILIIPLLGNIFIDGWNWGVLDFVFAFTLFFATGLAIDAAAHYVRSPARRWLAILGILLILFLIWVEIATDAVSRMLSAI